eukprot:TRINITY_DN72197_c0_g1_i1.p1 TRINITY_DN72197_c0_g1~~TRINITY_DN72197_c0_g1_i1.p1  ORF type:complete len:869 (+),score=96.04 TRINITY_DN72197_c0_g1_i1:101-2707(+)
MGPRRMRLSLVSLLLSSLPSCHSQATQASSTTTSEESTTTTSTPPIFTAPPVKTSERLDLPVLDFSVEGEDAISSNDEVISGVFMVYANIDQLTMQSGDIDIVVRETLGKVCKHFGSDAGAPTLTSMFMDVKTLGQERLGMNYTFHMLPPVEAGKDCINRLAMVGFGPKEPPYGELAPPPVRALLRAEMDAYRPLRFFDMTTWYLSIQNMSCDMRRVIKFWNHSRSIDVFPTEEPECLGGESIDWEPNLKGEFKTENVGSCSLAGSDACLCAAIPGCEWVPLVAGIRKCVWTQTPGVSCDACIYQPKCVMTPQKLCASRSIPCTCVMSEGGCAWDLTNNSCYYNPEGVTPCVACPRQYFCATPSIVRSEPADYSVMGSKDIGYSWFINITFDRRMEFRYSGLGSGISLVCWVRFLGDTSPIFELEYSKLAIVDNILYVNTNGISNEFMRDCELTIQDSVLRGASGLLPYSGTKMKNDVLVFSLPDTFPPQCQGFNPPNSARFVPLDVTLTFTFSEIIMIREEEGDSRLIDIIRLGGNISDPNADVIVGNFSILDATRVTVDGNLMMVKLEGLIDFSQYYSITLPAGVLTDRATNAFAGLGRAKYVFTTIQDGTVQKIVDSDKQVFDYTWIISTVVGTIIACLFLTVGYFFCINAQSKNKKAKVMAVENTPKFITTVKEDGTLQQTAPEPQKFVHEDGDDDWSDPVGPATSMYADTSRQNFYTAKSMTSSPRLAGSPSSAAVTAAEFLQRPDKLQVQVIAKPDDPKFDVRSQLRKSGSVVSLAETRENSLDAFRRIGVNDGGSFGGASPLSARRTPKWTPTHQVTSQGISPKADRRSSMARRSMSSSWSPSARGSKSARSSLSARSSKG